MLEDVTMCTSKPCASVHRLKSPLQMYTGLHFPTQSRPEKEQRKIRPRTTHLLHSPHSLAEPTVVHRTPSFAIPSDIDRIQFFLALLTFEEKILFHAIPTKPNVEGRIQTTKFHSSSFCKVATIKIKMFCIQMETWIFLSWFACPVVYFIECFGLLLNMVVHSDI